MQVGVLAVQGAFAEHKQMMESLGCTCREIRKKEDLSDISGIILPGGESTVQGKLIEALGIEDILREKIKEGLPTLATCAGLILIAENIVNDENVYLGTMPVSVKRNAYGRQLGSFERRADVRGFGEYPMIFIRAPFIESADDDNVEILADVDGHTVAAAYKNQIGLAFHPELSSDCRIHRAFLDKVKKFDAKAKRTFDQG